MSMFTNWNGPQVPPVKTSAMLELINAYTAVKEELEQLKVKVGGNTDVTTKSGNFIIASNTVSDNLKVLDTTIKNTNDTITELKSNIGTDNLNTTTSTVIGAINEIGTNAKNLAITIGSLSSLKTSDKSSVVTAINSIISTIDIINSKINNILDIKIGTVTTSIATSIATLDKNVTTNTTDIKAINSYIKSDVSTTNKLATTNDVANVNSTLATTKSTLNNTIGDLNTLETKNKSSTVTAINELNTELGKCVTKTTLTSNYTTAKQDTTTTKTHQVKYFDRTNRKVVTEDWPVVSVKYTVSEVSS